MGYFYHTGRETGRASSQVLAGLRAYAKGSCVKRAREINVEQDCGARSKQNGQKLNCEEEAGTREVREIGLKRERERGRDREKEKERETGGRVKNEGEGEKKLPAKKKKTPKSPLGMGQKRARRTRDEDRTGQGRGRESLMNKRGSRRTKEREREHAI